MPAEIHFTTNLLIKGALVFVLMDVIYVSFLTWQMKAESFRRLKWPLVIVAALVWFGIWSWAIGNFWETVYIYVFPVWGRTWIPWIAFAVAGVVALGLWTFATRVKWNCILTYCLSGAALGSLTHIWAVIRGILTKPPMLHGASPLAAILIAFFEYMFYWCVILTLAAGMDAIRQRWIHPTS